MMLSIEIQHKVYKHAIEFACKQIEAAWNA
jgi:hypothetical protein